MRHSQNMNAVPYSSCRTPVCELSSSPLRAHNTMADSDPHRALYCTTNSLPLSRHMLCNTCALTSPPQSTSDCTTTGTTTFIGNFPARRLVARLPRPVHCCFCSRNQVFRVRVSRLAPGPATRRDYLTGTGPERSWRRNDAGSTISGVQECYRSPGMMTHAYLHRVTLYTPGVRPLHCSHAHLHRNVRNTF